MINRHASFLLQFVCFAFLCPGSSYSANEAVKTTNDRPNIVMIVADDLGFADVSFKGSDIKTPNIDALAKTGIVLENYYGLHVCTPGRAALMTGRYPMRYGLQTLTIFPSHTYGLPLDEKTLPQVLKEAGYYTAMTGKWHLGHAYQKFWPQNRGFDYFYGNVSGGVDLFTKKRGNVIDWQRNGTFLKEEGYYDDQIGNDAVKIIKDHNYSAPLFLYVAFRAPHAPYVAPQEAINQYADTIKDPNRRTYAAMITEMDKQIGKIVKELEDKHVRNNTLIIFTSDNGGATNKMFATGPGQTKTTDIPTSNKPFRGGKGSLYEGGVRVPTIINWFGTLQPGVSNELLGHIDIMPTILAVAHVKDIHGKPMDGKNMIPALLNQTSQLHKNLLINVEQYRGAVRQGNWKLITTALLPGTVELYNLKTDPSETKNLASQYPDKVKGLMAILIDYAKVQQMSLWVNMQIKYLGTQGKFFLDPNYDIDDSGLPHEKLILPQTSH